MVGTVYTPVEQTAGGSKAKAVCMHCPFSWSQPPIPVLLALTALSGWKT